MMFTSFWSRDWGPTFKRSARLTIAVAALIFTVGSILAQGAYDLGRLTRLALEERNDQLAKAWVHALGVAAAPVRPVSVQASKAVAAPVAPPPPKPPKKRKPAAVTTTAKAKPRPARRRNPSTKVVEVTCG